MFKYGVSLQHVKSVDVIHGREVHEFPEQFVILFLNAPAFNVKPEQQFELFQYRTQVNIKYNA